MDAAFLKGSLDYSDPDLSLNIGRLASGVKYINASIANLETYKLTNSSMTHYFQRKEKTELLVSIVIQAQVGAWLQTFKKLSVAP